MRKSRYKILDILIWCLFPLVTGVILHATMPDYEWEFHKKAISFYGLCASIAVPVIACLYPRSKEMPGFSELSFCTLITISFLVVIGVLISPPSEPGVLSVYRSYYFSGMLGLFGGLQILAIKSGLREVNLKKFIIRMLIHGGILLILLGAVFGTAFGSRGILTIYEGGESHIYSITQGPYRLLSGKTALLGNCQMVKAPDNNAQEFDSYYVDCSPGFLTAATGMAITATGMVLALAVYPLQLPVRLLLLSPALPVALWAFFRFGSAPPALKSLWFVPHLTSYFTGYLYVLLIGILGAGILLFQRNRPGLFPVIDKLAYAAFIFLSLGLFIGSVWANEAWGSWWSWDPKESMALSQWLFMAAYLHLPQKWRLSKYGALTLFVIFLLTAFLYLGISLLPTAGASLHVY